MNRTRDAFTGQEYDPLAGIGGTMAEVPEAPRVYVGKEAAHELGIRSEAPSAFEAWWRDVPDERPDIRELAARAGWNAALDAAVVVAIELGDKHNYDARGAIKDGIISLKEKL